MCRIHTRTSLISSSLFLQQYPCLVRLTWMIFEKGGNSRTAAILWGVSSWIYLKQHVEFLCNFHLVFSLCVLLASVWCIHTIVLTLLPLARNPVWFYRIDQTFIWCNNLSIPVHAFSRHIVTWLSVDEIFLPRYANWSTDFRGLPLKVEISLHLKHINICFICVYMVANVFYCLLYSMQ